MSSTAREKVDEAKNHIDKAIRALAGIVVDECWGHDEFRSDYRDNIDEAFGELRAVKRKLSCESGICAACKAS